MGLRGIVRIGSIGLPRQPADRGEAADFQRRAAHFSAFLGRKRSRHRAAGQAASQARKGAAARQAIDDAFEIVHIALL